MLLSGTRDGSCRNEKSGAYSSKQSFSGTLVGNAMETADAVIDANALATFASQYWRRTGQEIAVWQKKND